MKRRIHKTVLSLRLLKLFIGSALLGLFVTSNSCNNGTCYKSKISTTKDSLKEDSLMRSDSLAKVKAKEDSAKVADSLHKADSIKKQRPPERPTCYIRPGPVKRKNERG